MWVSMETSMYTLVFLRKGAYTLKRMPNMVDTTKKNLFGLSLVVFLLVGHYPCYESSDFIIIKSSQY
jgi:hypothetical protein